MTKTTKHFYSHLVDMDSMKTELDVLTIEEGKKQELVELAHVHVHQIVMDAILSKLNDTDKTRLMELMAEGRDEDIWKHLNKKTVKIERTITDAAEQIKDEMRKDIKKIKSS